MPMCTFRGHERPHRLPGAASVLLTLLLALGCSGGSGVTGPTGGTPPDEDESPLPTVSTPEGESLGSPVTRLIDAKGGSLTSDDDRLTITVPPGTVAEPTTFSLETVENLMATGVGLAYKVGPPGRTFDPPLELEFTLEPRELEGVADEDWLIAFQPAPGPWQIATLAAPPSPLPLARLTLVGAGAGAATTPGAATIKGRLSRSGTVAPATRYGLFPSGRVIRVGQARNMTVFSLQITGPGEPLKLSEFEIAEGVEVGAWAVNGVPGGNDVVGHTVPNATRAASFQAPQAEPTPPTVTVSARVTDGGRTIPVSQKVLITAGDGYVVLDGAVTKRERWVTDMTGGQWPGRLESSLEVDEYLVRLGPATYLAQHAGATYPVELTYPYYRLRASAAMVHQHQGYCSFIDYTYSALVPEPAPLSMSQFLGVLELGGGEQAFNVQVRFSLTGGGTTVHYDYTEGITCSPGNQPTVESLTVPVHLGFNFDQDLIRVRRTAGSRYLTGQRRFDIFVAAPPEMEWLPDHHLRMRARWKIPYNPP